MPDKVKIGYECAGCGAEADTAVALEMGLRTSRVVVPHKQGCPVAARIALVRAQVLAGKR